MPYECPKCGVVMPDDRLNRNDHRKNGCNPYLRIRKITEEADEMEQKRKEKNGKVS